MLVRHIPLAELRAGRLHARQHGIDHADLRREGAELFGHRRHFRGADRLGDATGQAGKEAKLHGKTDLRLIVLIDVSRRIVKLRPAHVGIAVHEDALPRHLDVVEVHQRIVFVEPRRQWIVVDR